MSAQSKVPGVAGCLCTAPQGPARDPDSSTNVSAQEEAGEGHTRELPPNQVLLLQEMF